MKIKRNNYKLNIREKSFLYDTFDLIIKRGVFINGPIVKDFEKKFSKKIGSLYCAAFSSSPPGSLHTRRTNNGTSTNNSHHLQRRIQRHHHRRQPPRAGTRRHHRHEPLGRLCAGLRTTHHRAGRHQRTRHTGAHCRMVAAIHLAGQPGRIEQRPA